MRKLNCSKLDRPEYLTPLIVGQWAFRSLRAEHKLALALAEALETRGATRNDAAAQLLGDLLHGTSRFFLGEFVAARTLLERCTGLADPAYRTSVELALDPYATMLTSLALILACLGYIDQARSRMEEAMSEARRLGHVHTLAQTLGYANRLDWLTRSPMVHIEEVVALSTEYAFPHYLGFALACQVRQMLARGLAQEGLALITQGLAEVRARGGVASTPILFTWLAEAHGMLGQPTETRNCLAEAARVVEATEERVFDAELLHRVPGDLVNATGDQSAAERHYRQAIAIAELQSARLFQLRASTSLARLWRDQGKRQEAYELLAPVYDWFTEGFDTKDLQEAKSLLAELR